MENGNGGGVDEKIGSEDVISKLKDDGDFDRLRLNLIRKLKDNEELRNSIVSIVKQSVAINLPGADNLKPRQLADAIHQEVGGKLNEKISDVLWEIIRSSDSDGMKTDITETVKSVYDKLSRPKRDKYTESIVHDPKRIRNECHLHTSNNESTVEVNIISDNEPKEPPGFSQTISHQIDIITPITLSMETMNHQTQKGSNNDTHDNKEQGDDSDDDPDAPPGFG
uniref:uncharacterized protein LOC122579592 n=1 Tax=Erigeron canadensis TaxID=72917 RepID=UPI001CB8C46F|nr:uncharacterized protein LOC122579592 [Erigeron canadensis]